MGNGVRDKRSQDLYECISLLTTVSADTRSSPKAPSCVVQHSRGIGPSRDPNVVVERERALGLRVLSGVVRPPTRRVGTLDTDRLGLIGLGDAINEEEAILFMAGVLARLAGGRRLSGSGSTRCFLSFAIEEDGMRSGSCSCTRFRFFGVDGGAVTGARSMGVSSGAWR